MRLALGVEAVFHNHIIGIFKERTGISAFFNVLVIIDVGRAGMNFNGVRRHGFRGAHIFGQQFKIKLHFFRGRAGIAFAVGTDNGQSVAVLKDFFVIKDGPIPAVPLVGGEGDQTGDPVFGL